MLGGVYKHGNGGEFNGADIYLVGNQHAAFIIKTPKFEKDDSIVLKPQIHAKDVFSQAALQSQTVQIAPQVLVLEEGFYDATYYVVKLCFNNNKKVIHNFDCNSSGIVYRSNKYYLVFDRVECLEIEYCVVFSTIKN